MRKENIYAELGEIVAGKKSGRMTDDEIIVFDSTGWQPKTLRGRNCLRKSAHDQRRNLFPVRSLTMKWITREKIKVVAWRRG